MTQPAAPLALPDAAQPAPLAPAQPAPAQPVRGPASAYVARITATPTAPAAPPAPRPSFASAAGSMLGDVAVGAPTSAALGVGYAKGVVTKPRLLAAAGAAEAIAVASAPYLPTVSGVFRRAGQACFNALAFVAGYELGGGTRERAADARAESISEIEAEL